MNPNNKTIFGEFDRRAIVQLMSDLAYKLADTSDKIELRVDVTYSTGEPMLKISNAWGDLTHLQEGAK